ncbi:helix-turn-helix domain-containing protein [Burkholderia glumae]|uniref:helix-turn-helix domain-containing protein n=1 Tax=Burkholderia glumae TaxID=337 RepID=UPI00214A01B2|nr:helix-turn-helix domain-containing protein [Burkholderia glumae]MCR1767954.1 helix-turn-helix domain-containing protein [Burkholderia glumae]
MLPLPTTDELESLWQESVAQGGDNGTFLSTLLANVKGWLPVSEIILTVEPGGAGSWVTPVSAAQPPLCWSASGMARGAGTLAERAAETLVLRFAGRRLGTLQLFWLPGAGADANSSALVAELVRRLRWVVLRHTFHAANLGPMARSTLWVGAGRAIQRFTEHLEVAVRSHFPVYIAGEFGTDPSSVAGALHVFRCGVDAPFVEIRGAHPEGSPAEWFARAKGGTLYINGIQDMDPALLCELPGYLPSRLGQWASSPAKGESCHLVSSGLARAEQLMEAPALPRALMAELSLVELHVPPLRARIDDLRALFSHVCQCVGHDIELHCDDDAWQSLERRAWPENQLELTRLAAQLALSVQDRSVRLSDLAPAAAPVALLLGPAVQDAAAPADDAPAAAGEDAASGERADARALPRSAASWAQYVLQAEHGAGGEVEAMLPRALVRALRHLAAHYCDPLTQPDLASAACTSASHLTALFRRHLGVNFKTLLQHMRVQRARDLLCESRMVRVSDVAIRLGFADLSHFERCFKRITGCSPREYRMRFAP